LSYACDRNGAPRTLQVGAKLERQILAAKPLMTPPSAQSIAVSVDGGHVKSIRTYQMRSFEVMLACASNDRGEQQLFSSVPVEADRQRQQLNAVLRDLGATRTTPVTVLSDGAEGPRFLVRPRAQVRRVMSWIGSTFRCEFSMLHKQPEAGREDERGSPARRSAREND